MASRASKCVALYLSASVIPLLSTAQVASYDYDKLGRLCRATYSTGSIDYIYDPNGNRQAVNVALGTASAGGQPCVEIVPNIDSLNEVPSVLGESATQAHGTTERYNVLSNDSDGDGDSLSLVSEDSSYASITANEIEFSAPAMSGVYNVNYVVSDGRTGNATGTLTITVPNVAPNSNPDNGLSQDAGIVAEHDVLANDTDPNGDNLTLISVTALDGGTATIANNQLRFVSPVQVGAYRVQYVAEDTFGFATVQSAIATINIGNDAPVANSDESVQVHSTTFEHQVLSNDTDLNDPNKLALTVSGPNQGGFSVVNGQRVRFIAPATPGIYTYTYTLSDGAGGSDTADLIVTIPNVAPDARNDDFNQVYSSTAAHNVLANDTDPNDPSKSNLTISGPSQNGFSVVGDQVRFVSPAASGAYTYTYTLSDGDGGSDTAVLTVAVANEAPDANDDSYTQIAGTQKDYEVLANDTDANGDAPILLSVSGANASKVGQKLRYTAPYPTGTYSVSYVASDGQGGADSASVSVTVPNAPPDARADIATQNLATSVTHDVLANDTDLNDPEKTNLAISGPAQNGFSVVGNSVRFNAPLPAGDYAYTYTLSDGEGGIDAANLTVTVPNVPPQLSFFLSPNLPLNQISYVDPLEGAFDANGDDLTIVSTSEGTIHNGKLIRIDTTGMPVGTIDPVGIEFTVTDGVAVVSGNMDLIIGSGGGFPPFP